mgnify:FL=1
MKAADGDISEIKTEFGFTAQKFKAKESDLKDFCEQTNLHRDRYREQVFAVDTEKKIANFGRSTSSKAVWANKKALTNGDNSGIIKVQLPDGTFSQLADNNIMDIEIFARKGSNKELRVKHHLVNNYGGIADNWQHVKGRGYVATSKGPQKAMLHWFEEESVGIKEMKVKGWSKK